MTLAVGHLGKTPTLDEVAPRTCTPPKIARSGLRNIVDPEQRRSVQLRSNENKMGLRAPVPMVRRNVDAPAREFLLLLPEATLRRG